MPAFTGLSIKLEHKSARLPKSRRFLIYYTHPASSAQSRNLARTDIRDDTRLALEQRRVRGRIGRGALRLARLFPEGHCVGQGQRV